MSNPNISTHFRSLLISAVVLVAAAAMLFTATSSGLAQEATGTPTVAATRMLLPTFTPRPSAVPPTATPWPDASQYVPALLQTLQTAVTETERLNTQLATQAVDVEQSPQGFRSDLAAATKQIKDYRRQALTFDLKDMPPERRQKIALPALQAYLRYASYSLQWLAMQQTMYDAVQLTLTAPDSQKSAAQQELDDLQKEANAMQVKLAKLLKGVQDILPSVAAYAGYSEIDALTSWRVIHANSVDGNVLTLSAGPYKVFTRFAPSTVTLRLIGLTVGLASIDLPANGSEVNIANGTYRVEAAGATWWALALDPIVEGTPLATQSPTATITTTATEVSATAEATVQ